MLKLARHHLNKIGGGWAYYLEHGIPKDNRADGVDEDHEGLAALCARLKRFPPVLDLEEQGRFAIGFYYERCRQWPPTKKGNDGVSASNGGN